MNIGSVVHYGGDFFVAKFLFVQWLVDFFDLYLYFIFEWDEGNSTKSLDKHGVLTSLVEEVFYDPHLIILGEQFQPKTDEARYGIIGKALKGEILFVCFTLREEKIRPISSRTANKKEREFYEKEIC